VRVGTSVGSLVSRRGADASTGTIRRQWRAFGRAEPAAAIAFVEPVSPWQPTSAPEIGALDSMMPPIAAAVSTTVRTPRPDPAGLLPFDDPGQPAGPGTPPG